MGEVVPLDVTRLGRYQILKHLATGGMAEVLLARADGPFGGDHVVIKRVRRDQAADPHFVKMFMDEATLAASLQHPNIVRVHEIGSDQGEYFFSMEYVHGEDLRRVLMEVNRRRDKLPIALVTGIVAAAAAGLDHAHRQRGPNGEHLRIVHRDVSPANILVGYDGQVKVADFGIAKAALRTVETQSGTLKGKVSYMSPEQVTGRPVDRRSDVYALGIVLYEVVTARRLFKGDNDFLTMSSIVQGDIPLPSVHRPDLPRILEDIVMKALSPSPKDRYQSAEELRAELEKFTLAIGMRMSNGSIADYMRKLFGVREQPWLTDSEPTHTTTVDFDGSNSGLVQPSAAAVERQAMPAGERPVENSPIAMSRRVVTTRPLTVPDAPTSRAEAESSWVAKPPTGTGSGQPLAWSQQQPPPARRRYGIVLGMTAVAVIAGVLFLIRSMKHDEPEAHDVVAASTEPPAPPEPTRKLEDTKDEPAQPTTSDTAAAETAPAAKADTAAAAAAAAAAKEEAAAKATADAKAAKTEAARLAKEEAVAKAETAAKAVADAKAEKAEAARIAKAEKAEAARIAKAEAAAKAETSAKAAAAARAEKAEAARIAKAEAAAKAETSAKAAAAAKADAEKVAKAEATKAAPKPATTTKPRPKPAAKTDTKWNPNELFPE